MSYNYNQLTIVGRLTRDPETKMVSDNHKKTIFTVAVDRYYKKEDGSRDTDFIPVALWGKLGEIGQKILKKGKPVLVWGPMHINRYEDKNGGLSYYSELSSDGFQLLERMPDSNDTKIKQ